MPILGITDRRRLPRLGKIRTGIKAVNSRGVEYPKAVDYLVCPPEVQKVFGERPTEIEVMLPTESEEVFAQSFYKAYSATRGLVCKGDGKAANRLIDSDRKVAEPDTGVVTGPIANHKARKTEWATGITCPGQQCGYYAEGPQKQCREVMNLQFLIPKAPGMGVYQLDTGSYHSIINIYSGISLMRQLFGRVSMIPMTLSLEPMEVAPDGRKRVVHVLHLRNHLTLAEIAETRRRPLVAAAVIPPPDDGRDEMLFPEHGYEDDEQSSPPASAEDATERRRPRESRSAGKDPRWEEFLNWLDAQGRELYDLERVLGMSQGIADPATVGAFMKRRGIRSPSDLRSFLLAKWEAENTSEDDTQIWKVSDDGDTQPEMPMDAPYVRMPH